MRRCPHCQSPNPSRALYCSQCGKELPPLPKEAWLRWDDLWSAADLRRLPLPLALLLAYRLSFGSLLTAGMERQESRFLLFHLGSGLVLGAGLAWLRRARGPLDWTAWLLAGLAGGFLAEALEVWYTYRHLMGTLTYYAWDWFELPPSPALIYRILQGLRTLGLALPVLLLAWRLEKRFIRGVFALLWVLAATAWRVPVRGAFLHWGNLLDPLGLTQAAYYALSSLCLFYGLAPRALTPGPEDR